MAKEKTKTAKKRKGATAAPKADTEGLVLGSVLIPVQASVQVGAVAAFNELVIEWGCLGLSEEPDAVTEVSGNARMLDPKRPPFTDEEGLHVFFDPPIAGGTSYGFLFNFLYNDSVEARTAAPKSDEELAAESKERKAASSAEKDY
jgi:hypothetical protein